LAHKPDGTLINCVSRKPFTLSRDRDRAPKIPLYVLFDGQILPLKHTYADIDNPRKFRALRTQPTTFYVIHNPAPKEEKA